MSAILITKTVINVQSISMISFVCQDLKRKTHISDRVPSKEAIFSKIVFYVLESLSNGDCQVNKLGSTDCIILFLKLLFLNIYS